MLLSLHKKIESDMLAAIKQKDAFRLKVLRYLKSNLDSAAKDKKEDLTDDESIKVIQRRIKQSNDSEAQYRAGGREDLADAEKKEKDLIASYLPPQLSKEELDGIIKKVISETGATNPKDFGLVMKKVMSQVAGKADGAAVKAAVDGHLNNNKQ